MTRTLTFQITQADHGLPISRYLKHRGFSTQSLIQIKKEPDGTLLNGRPAFQNVRICAGDTLTVQIRESDPSAHIAPVELPLSILYEDEDLLVVDKPAGMPTHPSMKNYDNTLANALAWYFAVQNRPFVFRCIGRLDRDTSGLLIVAKHIVSAGILSGSPVEKEYLAIVRGSLTPPLGTITAPLGRKEGSVIERTVDYEHGEAAVTHYRLLHEKNGHSLVSLTLETGRTHQIRIHMKSIGYPLIGDYLYNPDTEYMHRQALHVHSLRFTHPITGSVMCFSSPLPEDMRWMA